jgi:hypothetical protein
VRAKTTIALDLYLPQNPLLQFRVYRALAAKIWTQSQIYCFSGSPRTITVALHIRFLEGLIVSRPPDPHSRPVAVPDRNANSMLRRSAR